MSIWHRNLIDFKLKSIISLQIVLVFDIYKVNDSMQYFKALKFNTGSMCLKAKGHSLNFYEAKKICTLLLYLTAGKSKAELLKFLVPFEFAK